jgi:hypothetical protein
VARALNAQGNSALASEVLDILQAMALIESSEGLTFCAASVMERATSA